MLSGIGNVTSIFSALSSPTFVTIIFTLNSSCSLTASLFPERTKLNSGPSPVVKPTLSGLDVSSVTAISELFV